MGRHYQFKLGSFYRTSDRTGFPQRAEITKKQWDGLYVEEAQWEPRQPQDLVRGVIDKQSVPEPRPLGPNIFVGPFSTQITANLTIGTFVIPVQSTFGFTVNDAIGVMLDSGSIFQGFVDEVGSSTIQISSWLTGSVSSGNLIFDYGQTATVNGVLLDNLNQPLLDNLGQSLQENR